VTVTEYSTTQRERATEPLQPDKSLGALFGEFTSELGELFRKEIELAKVEGREEVKKAGAGLGMLAGAALAGLLALSMLSMALAWLLDKGLDRGLSFAIVGVVWAIAAAVLASKGKQQAAAAKPLPETVQSLKEDAQWVKAQKS
jgi:uncharacterized membrane protein YqjE